jgi:protein SCO1/2
MGSANLLTISDFGKWVKRMTPCYSLVRRWAAGLLIMAVGLGAGCAKAKPAAGAVPPVVTAPTEQRYPLTGEIIEVQRENQILVVTHDEIKGYMPGMTMEFKAARGDLENAQPGQHIRAELVVRGSEFSLEKIWPADDATDRALTAAAQILTQDTAMRGKSAYREIGETLPEFTLLDQTGRTISPSRFRGKQVVLNFIFTRCPVATMCPAATLRMQELQQAARAAGVTNLELVSISLDPEFDTPGVLKEYAEVRGINLVNFSFLTGPDAAVRQLLAQLGVIREFEGATIKHNLATVLINPQGKIIYRADGSAWAVDDFVRRLKKE